MDATRRYAIAWRWHGYAGLVLAPLAVAIAATGALYVFKDVVEPRIAAPRFSVEPAPRHASPDAWIAAARDAAPDHAPWRVYIDGDPRRAVEVHLLGADRTRIAADIDPYRARVLGIDPFESRPFRVIMNLHRSFLVGTPGRLLTELFAGWALVLSGTGLYLWARTRKTASAQRKQSWSSRFRWRTLHRTAGFVAFVPIGYLAATGLVFTLGSGTVVKGIAFAVGAIPASLVRTPASTPYGTDARIGAERALEAARAGGIGSPPLLLTLPTAPTDAYTVQTNDTSSPSRYARVVVDAYTGDVLAKTTWDDLGMPAKLVIAAYALHTGNVYGWPSRLFVLVGSFGLAVLSSTGAAMWWLRPPSARRLELPSVAFVREQGVPLWAFAIVGVALPAFAASVIAVAATERWRFARASTALGPDDAPAKRYEP